MMKAEADKVIPVKDILELHKKQMLVVNAEYQRGAVWTSAQKKKLVDSVLRGYPLPLIYLHLIKQEAGNLVSQRYEVIDGQQRITALSEFHEGAFKLFDPVKDAQEARFPEFIKKQPCPWGGRSWRDLSVDEQQRFLETPLPVVRIETGDENEARDLFVRLQAGMPLNSQEKRDAWPGQFTDFILFLGGKPGLARYPGHEFFGVLMKANRAKDRGKFRQYAAQVAMQYLTKRRTKGEHLRDINAEAMDDFYYENLDFDADSPDAERLCEILDKIMMLLRDQKRKKIAGHEAIHLVLLADSLWDDYTHSWEANFARAFDAFRLAVTLATATKDAANPAEHWLRYGIYTRVNSDRADNIRRRHEFFCTQMWPVLKPQLKDPKRLFGALEREIIYYRDRKVCQFCEILGRPHEVAWDEAEIHHVEGHAGGGPTTLTNGCLVDAHCHPKGNAAAEFAEKWNAKQGAVSRPQAPEPRAEQKPRRRSVFDQLDEGD